MKLRTLLIGVGATIALANLSNAAHAQGFNFAPTLYNRPTVSPYLNLLNNSAVGTAPYQTLVKPLIDQRDESLRQQDGLRNLQSQVRENRAAIRGGTSGLRSTGHSTRFMNYSHYYGGIRR